MAQRKYEINEKASSAYIMGLYANKPDNANDIRFYMNVAFQMATTLVHKTANERLEDASFTAAIISVINAAQTLSVQLNLNDENTKRDELEEEIKALDIQFKKIYEPGGLDNDQKAKVLSRCMKVLKIILRDFGEFNMYFDRPGAAKI